MPLYLHPRDLHCGKIQGIHPREIIQTPTIVTARPINIE